MPGSICGTWRAFWTLGPDRPYNGAIIEGVNNQENNAMVLHTSPQCNITDSEQSETLVLEECDSSKNDNAGCGFRASSGLSYARYLMLSLEDFYATEWTSDYIRIWFWSRNDVPEDVKSENPDPSTWGNPQANFHGNCDMDSHFVNQKLVFNTAFCGDWGELAWGFDVCSRKTLTCAQYVAENARAFRDM